MDSSQKLVFVYFELLENIGEKVGANICSGMERNGRPAAIRVVEYGVAALLTNLLEA